MFDIIIIGSGPAGMTAAIYARRASLDALVLEKDAMGSGQIAVTEQVDNYPGLPRIGGSELGEKFREHAEELGASFSENEVAALTKTDGIFTVFMKDGTSVTGKSVIYAMFAEGARRLEPNGALWLVIRKQQGAESAAAYLKTLFGQVEAVTKKGGYWVLRCARPVENV